MLKSLSTQFALTLFFGPLGLLYSSVASAVFLSLVLAVLYFTVMGTLAVFLMWPVAIIVGLVFVKMHNDQMRQSGSRLLLGPGEEAHLVSTMGSWGRGVAVLSFLAIGGYLGYWYLGGVDKSRSKTELAESSVLDSQSESWVTETDSTAITTVSSSSSSLSSSTEEDWNVEIVESSVEPSNVITFDEGEVTPAVIESSASTPIVEFSEVTETLLYVDAQLVNLREGPGTNYSVVDKIENGAELQELDRAGTWVNVSEVNTGATGWIYSGLLRSER